MNTETSFSHPQHGWKHRRGWLRIPIIIVVAFAAVILFSYIVMLLWNKLIPDIFHGPTISFWQALGLLILTRIFFHGFSGHGGWRGGKGRQWGRHYWKEKWEKMSPEERQKFRANMQRRCGVGYQGWWNDEPGSTMEDPSPNPTQAAS